MNLEISKTTFTNASAAKTGGAVFVKDILTVSLISSVITDAESGSGGCASIEGANVVSITESKMLNCDSKSGVGSRAVCICPVKQAFYEGPKPINRYLFISILQLDAVCHKKLMMVGRK